MEPAAMAYVAVVISGISLQSPEPVTVEQCNAFKLEQPQTLCVDIEPACGRGEAVKCLGRADLEEAPPRKAAPKKKKRTVYYRARPKMKRTSSVTVGQLVQKAF